MDYTIKLALIFWDGGSSKNLFRFAVLIPFFIYMINTENLEDFNPVKDIPRTLKQMVQSFFFKFLWNRQSYVDFRENLVRDLTSSKIFRITLSSDFESNLFKSGGGPIMFFVFLRSPLFLFWEN